MIEKIAEAIKEAESNGLLTALDEKAEVQQGYSGNKLIGVLQRLGVIFSEVQDVCYLEIGVFQGFTLLSVASACSKLPCYGIDDFAHFDPEGENFGRVKHSISRLGLTNVTVINKDYEDALEYLKKYVGAQKIGIYFIDGPHDYRSQLMCLELATPYLYENGVIVIDDCNYRHVRQANRDFLVTHPEYKLVFEAYTPCHPKNMTASQEKAARKGWWNGVNILVRDPEQKLSPMYPPTERSRQLYENEHIVHGSNLAEFAPQALSLLQSILEGNFITLVARIARMNSLLSRQNKNLINRYVAMNTYSENLPAANFNQSL